MFPWYLTLIALLSYGLMMTTAVIECRAACRRCRDGVDVISILKVYCSMCKECLDRRRERLKLNSTVEPVSKQTNDTSNINLRRRFHKGRHTKKGVARRNPANGDIVDLESDKIHETVGIKSNTYEGTKMPQGDGSNVEGGDTYSQNKEGDAFFKPEENMEQRHHLETGENITPRVDSNTNAPYSYVPDYADIQETMNPRDYVNVEDDRIPDRGTYNQYADNSAQNFEVSELNTREYDAPVSHDYIVPGGDAYLEGGNLKNIGRGGGSFNTSKKERMPGYYSNARLNNTSNSHYNIPGSDKQSGDVLIPAHVNLSEEQIVLKDYPDAEDYGLNGEDGSITGDVMSKQKQILEGQDAEYYGDWPDHCPTPPFCDEGSGETNTVSRTTVPRLTARHNARIQAPASDCPPILTCRKRTTRQMPQSTQKCCMSCSSACGHKLDVNLNWNTGFPGSATNIPVGHINIPRTKSNTPAYNNNILGNNVCNNIDGCNSMNVIQVGSANIPNMNPDNVFIPGNLNTKEGNLQANLLRINPGSDLNNRGINVPVDGNSFQNSNGGNIYKPDNNNMPDGNTDVNNNTDKDGDYVYLYVGLPKEFRRQG